MRAGYRRAAAVLGLAALAGGVTALWTARGGTELVAFVSVAGGGVGVAMTYLLYRDWLPESAVDPPEVERAARHPAPGDDFDATLAQFDGSGRGYLPDRGALHDRLREAAAQVMTRREGVARETAATAIADGEWPDDDPVVASFLENPNVALPRSWRDRVFGLVRDEGSSDFQELVRRTVDVLVERSDLVDAEADADTPGVVVTDPHGPDEERTRTTTGRHGDGSDPVTAADGAGRRLRSVATDRWRAVVPAALAFVGFGFVLRAPPVVLAGVVALGFGAYARAFVPPAPALSVSRSLDVDRPAPGDEVTVTATVRNDGDRTLPDLRLVDGVPAGLSVEDGSPRYGTTLRPGEGITFSYTVTARRGDHEFGPAFAVVRDHAGTTAVVYLIDDTAETSLTCVPTLSRLPVPVPLYAQSGEYLGRIPAQGGEGVEFHATREYRPGDPTTRIDWKRLARSADDELTTVQFREERAATVALVVDALPSAYLAAGPDEPGAVEHSVEAAGRLFGSLLDVGDRVGVAALGPTTAWLDPGVGIEHRKRVEERLAADPAFPPTAPSEEELPPYWVREFHRRFPAETQVVLLTPLCDRRHRFVIRRLRAYGHPVTVVAPDPTADGTGATVGQCLVGLERRLRIEALRESGVRVVDWDPDDDLALALGRAAGRWSA